MKMQVTNGSFAVLVWCAMSKLQRTWQVM